MNDFLKEGDMIELRAGDRIYAMVPAHFVYDNAKGDYALVHHDIAITGELSYFAGEYVVYKTAHDGGGTGHGANDVYPSGHHVFCERLDNPEMKADFYQSGAFTAMIEHRKPMGQAQRKWVRP